MEAWCFLYIGVWRIFLWSAYKVCGAEYLEMRSTKLAKVSSWRELLGTRAFVLLAMGRKASAAHLKLLLLHLKEDLGWETGRLGKGNMKEKLIHLKH